MVIRNVPPRPRPFTQEQSPALIPSDGLVQTQAAPRLSSLEEVIAAYGLEDTVQVLDEQVPSYPEEAAPQPATPAQAAAPTAEPAPTTTATGTAQQQTASEGGGGTTSPFQEITLREAYELTGDLDKAERLTKKHNRMVRDRAARERLRKLDEKPLDAARERNAERDRVEQETGTRPGIGRVPRLRFAGARLEEERRLRQERMQRGLEALAQRRTAEDTQRRNEALGRG